jgi:hypothetical protein
LECSVYQLELFTWELGSLSRTLTCMGWWCDKERFFE